MNVTVPKSQPIAYAQMAFYLHRLGDTDTVTATIKVTGILAFTNSINQLIYFAIKGHRPLTNHTSSTNTVSYTHLTLPTILRV